MAVGDKNDPAVPWMFKITDFGKSAKPDSHGEFPHNDGDKEYSRLTPVVHFLGLTLVDSGTRMLQTS